MCEKGTPDSKPKGTNNYMSESIILASLIEIEAGVVKYV